MTIARTPLTRRLAAVLTVAAAALAAPALRAQDAEVEADATTDAPRRLDRKGGKPLKPIQRPNFRDRFGTQAGPPNVGVPRQEAAPERPMPGPRPSIVPSRTAPVKPLGKAAVKAGPGAATGTPRTNGARLSQAPDPVEPPDHKTVGKKAQTFMMNFDKRDLAEVIQFVSTVTQRNFILPERVGGKITILSNSPIPADEVWNVFTAALDANNWALYPVGRYWKLSEKKQSTRANIPLYLERDAEPPANEQMVTKLFKLRNVDADQMRNTLNQFTSRDSDFQIFPPDTLIISELGLNMRRLERLIAELDRPGGAEEVRIVQIQYAGAQELATKLTEIFQAQASGGKAGSHRTLGIADPVPNQVPGVPPPIQNQVPGAAASAGGSVSVSKIIAEERTNKLIVIANSKSFERVLGLIKQLDVPSGGGGVHVYYLENAKAEELAATLQSLAQGVAGGSSSGGNRSGARRTGNIPGAPAALPGAIGGGAPGGAAGSGTAELFSGDVKITADKNSNALVIIASPTDYRNLVKVIQQLDTRRRQVFVEAVIMEVNLKDGTDLGLSGHAGTVVDNLNFRGASGSAPVVFGSELGGLNSIGGIASLASLGGFLAGIQGPPITVPGINLQLPSFGVVLNALQSSSDVNVISTPNVLMSDNSEGEITVGQNVPFPAGAAPNLGSLLGSTGTTGTTGGVGALGGLGLGGLSGLYQPIQRQNVELRLRIKPQINESDYVRLEVDEQTEEIAEVDKTLGPTTSKRSAKTTVVAKDQETVVLGGLIQERTVKSVQKVPILGSIPVLGWLFRNESTQKTKTNLLLFLTPYIIRDQSDFRRIFERKMAERAEFVKRFYGEGANYTAAIDYERKLGPLQRVRAALTYELSKAENGGSGAVGEKVIGPTQRYVPQQLEPSTAKTPGADAPIGGKDTKATGKAPDGKAAPKADEPKVEGPIDGEREITPVETTPVDPAPDAEKTDKPSPSSTPPEANP